LTTVSTRAGSGGVVGQAWPRWPAGGRRRRGCGRYRAGKPRRSLRFGELVGPRVCRGYQCVPPVKAMPARRQGTVGCYSKSAPTQPGSFVGLYSSEHGCGSECSASGGTILLIGSAPVFSQQHDWIALPKAVDSPIWRGRRSCCNVQTFFNCRN
jgi:hypothetical protein